MNCAVCSRYLSFLNNLKRSKCPGCRPGRKQCTYLFRDCHGPKNDSASHPAFCFQCDEYPCRQIDRMDKRYRAFYRMSIRENLEFIQEHGLTEFVEHQYRLHRCPTCSGLISTHNGKCFKCDTINSLIEKRCPVAASDARKGALRRKSKCQKTASNKRQSVPYRKRLQAIYVRRHHGSASKDEERTTSPVLRRGRSIR